MHQSHPVIASAAKQSTSAHAEGMDCRVASLLAKTKDPTAVIARQKRDARLHAKDRAIQHTAASPFHGMASGILDRRFRGDDSANCPSLSDANELM